MFGSLLLHTNSLNILTGATKVMRLSSLQVCKCSNEICLQLYEKEQLTDSSYLHIHGFVLCMLQCSIIQQKSVLPFIISVLSITG